MQTSNDKKSLKRKKPHSGVHTLFTKSEEKPVKQLPARAGIHTLFDKKPISAESKHLSSAPDITSIETKSIFSQKNASHLPQSSSSEQKLTTTARNVGIGVSGSLLFIGALTNLPTVAAIGIGLLIGNVLGNLLLSDSTDNNQSSLPTPPSRR